MALPYFDLLFNAKLLSSELRRKHPKQRQNKVDRQKWHHVAMRLRAAGQTQRAYSHGGIWRVCVIELTERRIRPNTAARASLCAGVCVGLGHMAVRGNLAGGQGYGLHAAG